MLTVNPVPALSSLVLVPAGVIGGSSSTGTVTLTSPAGPGGLVVNLSSSNTAVATTPASVAIAAGQTTATFSVSTTAVVAWNLKQTVPAREPIRYHLIPRM